MKKENEILKIKDLNAAAYLLTNKIELIKTSKEGRVVYFYFSKEKTDKVLLKFTMGTATVNVRDFIDSLNRAKDVIFGGL